MLFCVTQETRPRCEPQPNRPEPLPLRLTESSRNGHGFQMRFLNKAIAAIILGLVTPFTVYVSLMRLLVAMALRWPWVVDLAGLLLVLVSVCVGFAFLVRPFRRQVVVTAIIYFPAMMWAVNHYGPSMSAKLFGTSL